MIQTTTYPEAKRIDPDAEQYRKVCDELRQNFRQYQEVNAEFERNADDDLDFLAGGEGHWRDEHGDMREQLKKAKRSAISIDLLSPAIDLIVNQARINKVTAVFVPVGEGADKATADIRQGLYRNIERESNASVARETAYQFAVSCGRGAYRVIVDDEPGLTFDKCIKIKRIDNLKSFAYDPHCLEFDCSDMEWAAFWDDLSLSQFQASYPTDTDGNPIDTSGSGLPEPDRLTWFNDKRVRVVEYFRKVWFERTICKLPDGFLVNGNMYCDAKDLPPQLIPVAKLKKRDYRIEWYRMTGSQIIEKRDWPGKYIPLVVVTGREVFRGRAPKIAYGMVRTARELVQVHNYMESRLLDEVAYSPLPHVFSPSGALTPQNKGLINSINTFGWSVIEYEVKMGPDGLPLPPPAWVTAAPNIQAVVQGAMHSKDNLQRVLSTFAPQLGYIQGDQSGRAIREVKDQGDVTHAAFPDNLNRSILHEARIVNDLMDQIYNEARSITITDPDESTRRILINKPFQDEKTGEQKTYLFGGGKYDVAISIGPAWPTRQQESRDKLLEAAKLIPSIGTRAPDLMVQTLNLPSGMGEKIAERIKPPDVMDDDKVNIQQLMQAHTQQGQLIDLLTKRLDEMTRAAQAKQQEMEARILTNLRDNQVKLITEWNKTGSAESVAALNAELAQQQAQEAQAAAARTQNGAKRNEGTPTP